jgi:hypothetical protein
VGKYYKAEALDIAMDAPSVLSKYIGTDPLVRGVICVCRDTKVSNAEDVLPDGTTIFKNMSIAFNCFVMGRDPRRYPDPLKFDPTRWIPFREPDPFEFPVFQAGPRVCLGNRMALLSAKVLTTMLLQHFRFTLEEGEAGKITYSLMLTMSVRNSAPQQESSFQLLLRLHKRTRPEVPVHTSCQAWGEGEPFVTNQKQGDLLVRNIQASG